MIIFAKVALTTLGGVLLYKIAVEFRRRYVQRRNSRRTPFRPMQQINRRST